MVSVTDSRLKSPPQSRSERRKLETRQRLMQAAWFLLIQEGYKNTTIKAITDHADVGYGTFYGHFETKEDIIWAVFRVAADQLYADTEQKNAGLPSPMREYMGWVGYFESIAQFRALLGPMIGPSGNTTLREKYQSYVLETVLGNLQQRRYVPAPMFADFPLDYLARFMAGTQVHLTEWLLTPGCPYTAREMATLLFRTIYHENPPA